MRLNRSTYCFLVLLARVGIAAVVCCNAGDVPDVSPKMQSDFQVCVAQYTLVSIGLSVLAEPAGS